MYTPSVSYGESWSLRGYFLLHLQGRETYGISTTTSTTFRAIKIDWWYATDPYLPPWAALDFCSWEDLDEGTMKQMEIHKAS
ncbi:hypothetical protein BGZ60DRAFT_410258 [Tricladium varicosporioides]|nr:hypothetical protein BGZ60DRAFT_410258 [Hymenoscyphus varicosporioides]